VCYVGGKLYSVLYKSLDLKMSSLQICDTEGLFSKEAHASTWYRMFTFVAQLVNGGVGEACLEPNTKKGH
jgi:hypothetical protein